MYLTFGEFGCSEGGECLFAGCRYLSHENIVTYLMALVQTFVWSSCGKLAPGLDGPAAGVVRCGISRRRGRHRGPEGVSLLIRSLRSLWDG